MIDCRVFSILMRAKLDRIKKITLWLQSTLEKLYGWFDLGGMTIWKAKVIIYTTRPIKVII